MSLAQTHGAIASVSGEYPGWPLRKESRLVPLMSEIYEKMYGKKPEVVAIHAGLECGIFSQHMPDLDIVSYGPDLSIFTRRRNVSPCPPPNAPGNIRKRS